MSLLPAAAPASPGSWKGCVGVVFFRRSRRPRALVGTCDEAQMNQSQSLSFVVAQCRSAREVTVPSAQNPSAQRFLSYPFRPLAFLVRPLHKLSNRAPACNGNDAWRRCPVCLLSAICPFVSVSRASLTLCAISSSIRLLYFFSQDSLWLPLWVRAPRNLG